VLLGLILLMPLLGFFANAFLFKSPHKKRSGLIAVSAPLLSFLFCLIYVFTVGFKEQQSLVLFEWLNLEDISLQFSFVLDPLSLIMCLLITGVGFLIHFYSFFYMFKDSGFIRYFSYLNLFIFMMLVLVLSDNLPLLFLGWEGVGLCSYLLIGFWFKQQEKVHSSSMAFIVNRIGDAFFLLGIFILFSHLKTFQFSEINTFFKEDSAFISPSLSWSALFLFLGAVGKSAQIPLYFWLPKAMAGPTPVSALIHAATMVTAGVYLLVRLSHFYMAFPFVLEFIAWIGAFTALGSALIACKTSDFKGVLAYSTISQLAYLFMAIGVKAFSSSIFHLLTHGFFKALLFLCSASVIQALSGEQNIKKMGGLKTHLPITFLCYLAGTLALVALPPFSGFFSKDEILWSLFSSSHYFLFTIAFLTGLLTSFYMTRLSFYVFFGKLQKKPQTENSFFNVPLLILAFCSVVSGFVLGFPHLISEILAFHPLHFLQTVLKDFSPLSFKGLLWQEALIMFFSTFGSLTVIAISFFCYSKKQVFSFWPFGQKTLEAGFYIPFFIEKVIQPSFKKSCHQLFHFFELRFFNQIAPFLSLQILTLKKFFSQFQNSNLQSYVLYFTLGLTLMIFLMFL